MQVTFIKNLMQQNVSLNCEIQCIYWDVTSSWQMWSRCQASGSWWDCGQEKENIIWRSFTGFSPPRVWLWRRFKKNRYSSFFKYLTQRFSCWQFASVMCTVRQSLQPDREWRDCHACARLPVWVGVLRSDERQVWEDQRRTRRLLCIPREPPGELSLHYSQRAALPSQQSNGPDSFAKSHMVPFSLRATCRVQNSVFGEGTYLTSDLSMAVLYSPHCSSWRESLLGSLLSCVALCEVIDHPDVKCQVKKKGG